MLLLARGSNTKMDEITNNANLSHKPGLRSILSRSILLASIIIFYSICLCEDLYALNPSRSLTQYRCRFWGVEHGLPHSSANGISQSTDGYIWIATTYGCARFNGNRFTPFVPDNTPAITRPKVNCLSAQRDGSIWFGMQGDGVLQYQNRHFNSFLGNKQLLNPNINCIFEDSKGRKWVGSTSGATIFAGSSSISKINTILQKNEVFSIFENETNQIWIGTLLGLYGPITNIHSSELPLHPTIRSTVRSICSNGKGGLWIGTDLGLYHMDNGHTQLYKTDNGLKSSVVTAVYRDSQGILWIGTRLGLNRIIGSNVLIENPIPALDFTAINGFTEDMEGNLWIACGKGLYCLSDTRFITLSAQDGLIHEEANSLTEGPDGSLWIATARGGIYRMNESKFEPFKQRPSYNTLTSILMDNQQRIWVGTRLQGLFSIDGNSINNYTMKKGLATNNIMALCSDHLGRIWIGTPAGLNYFEKGKIHSMLLPAKGRQPNIRSVFVETNGTIWLGTSAGVYSITQSQTNQYDIADGLPISLVYHITQDRQQRVWIGTSNGLGCFLDGKWHSWKPINIADRHHVYWLVDDGLGFIWYSTPRTIFRVSIQSLLNHWRHISSNIDFATFSHADGLMDSACIGGRQPAGCQTRDGRIWFPTYRGLAVVNPTQIMPNPIPPVVQIEKFLANGREIETDERITLPHTTRRIDLQFAALSYTSPESVRYQYKLNGFDPEVIESLDHSATYANLRPGLYHFQVNACNRDGIWNELGAGLSFTIVPAFHQTTYFYVICGLSIGLVVIGIHILRLRVLKQQKIQLEQLVNVRTRELEHRMQDCIRLETELREAQKMEAIGQMAAGVAHYFNNLLTVIQGNSSLIQQMEYLSEQGKNNAQSIDKASYRAADIVRHLLTFSQKQWIKKSAVDLNQIARDEAENLKQNQGKTVTVVTELAPDLPPVNGDSSLIKKAVCHITENAIDFMPEPGIITIRTRIEEFKPSQTNSEASAKTSIFCLMSISDTGKGMSAETQKHLFEPFFTTKEVGKGTGLGLAFVYGVVKQLGGFIEVTSVLNKGTEFRLYFPCQPKG